jgi:hypothetical protein
MLLSEIYQQLLAGELSQTKMAETGFENLSDADTVKLANHVNFALTALYKRFALKQRELAFPLEADTQTYELDLVDLLKIEKVIAVDTDYEFPLNRDDNEYSLYTPQLNVVKVPLRVANQDPLLPADLITATMRVVYRANHPRIVTSEGYVDSEAVTLELPESHMYALCLYVAARMNLPLGTGQFEGFASHNSFTKFEAECQRLETEGLAIDHDSQNIKLYERGFA